MRVNPVTRPVAKFLSETRRIRVASRGVKRISAKNLIRHGYSINTRGRLFGNTGHVLGNASCSEVYRGSVFYGRFLVPCDFSVTSFPVFIPGKFCAALRLPDHNNNDQRQLNDAWMAVDSTWTK